MIQGIVCFCEDPFFFEQMGDVAEKDIIQVALVGSEKSDQSVFHVTYQTGGVSV